MSVIAEFTVNADEFPLGSIFTTHPDASIELERIVPTRSAPIPYFWVEGVPTDVVESAFEEHPEVESISLLDEINGDCLLRIDWSSEGHGILRALVDSQVSLLSATGSSRGWSFEIRGSSGGAISEFQDSCRGNEVPVVLQKYHHLVPREDFNDELTATQREALLLAYERGYYRRPRQTSLEEMGSELGISGQSMGSRLQRGIHRLIGSTLPE